ncbi:MAG: hypothetical protein LUC18_00745 [Porphyromonadaceae bacterium]|nr:hypothetical protein [Porphyromonadaceae bacterium]
MDNSEKPAEPTRGAGKSAGFTCQRGRLEHRSRTGRVPWRERLKEKVRCVGTWRSEAARCLYATSGRPGPEREPLPRRAQGVLAAGGESKVSFCL